MNICFSRFHRRSKAFLYRLYYDKQREWQRVSGYQATGTAIQNPFTFYYVQNNDWSSTHSYQFWNKNFTAAASVNNTETVKTIYSPSPSGFVEPKTAAFTSFTLTGENTYNLSQFNVSGGFNAGWYFFTKGWKMGDTCYFPVSGYRDVYNKSQNTTGNGEIAGVYTNGYSWTVGATSLYNASFFDYGTSNVTPQIAYYRSSGFGIRPVLE